MRYNYREHIEYNETFFPLVKMTTIRCLLAIIIKTDWPISQLEVNDAFLYCDLQENVYMKFHAGLIPHSPNFMCIPKKYLNGSKQASGKQYVWLMGAFNFKGYYFSLNDYYLFFKRTCDFITTVTVYVDDILITVNHPKESHRVEGHSTYLFLH